MVNVLELDVLFDVELFDRGGTHSIPRMAHYTFDLTAQTHVLSKFTSRSCVISVTSLSADLMRSAWKNFVSMFCVSHITMV